MEIFADAYAGINNFGAGIFTEDVNQWMDDHGAGKQSRIENGTKKATGPPDSALNERYSIKTLPDDKKYVHADRQVIFGNDPDSWSEQVEDYINGKIRRGQDVKLIAEDGGVFTITSDTAGKMSSRRTNVGTTLEDDTFYVKANAAVHIDELVAVSFPANAKTLADHSGRHGDFAKDGWQYRTVFFQDFDGKYYRLQISVAKGAKGDVPYNIGRIEERSFPTINGSSAKGGALNGKTSFEKSIPEKTDDVNSETEDHLSAEPDGADEDTAQEGRAAEHAGTSADEGDKSSVRTTLPAKARSYLKGVENKLLSKLCETLSVTKYAGRTYLQEIVADISKEYLRTGTISVESTSFLFDKAYAQGIVVDSEFYDAYKHIKDHLRTTAVTIS